MGAFHLGFTIIVMMIGIVESNQTANSANTSPNDETRRKVLNGERRRRAQLLRGLSVVASYFPAKQPLNFGRGVSRACLCR